MKSAKHPSQSRKTLIGGGEAACRAANADSSKPSSTKTQRQKQRVSRWSTFPVSSFAVSTLPVTSDRLHPFTCSPVYPFTRSPVHPFTHLPVHPLTSSLHQFASSPVHRLLDHGHSGIGRRPARSKVRVTRIVGRGHRTKAACQGVEVVGIVSRRRDEWVVALAHEHEIAVRDAQRA